jgi:hypothetical protein
MSMWASVWLARRSRSYMEGWRVVEAFYSNRIYWRCMDKTSELLPQSSIPPLNVERGRGGRFE